MAEKTPKPRIVPEPPSDDEELCPLFDEPDREIPIPVSAVAHIKVFRVTVDSETGKELPSSWVVELEPTASYRDLAAQCGGGTYDLSAWNKRYVAKRRMSIDGAPKTARGANVNPLLAQPVHEMASGLVAVSGLSPEMQLVFALMQQQSAQTREDMRFQSEQQTKMFQAMSARPEPTAAPVANPNVALLTAMMETQRAEITAMRAALDDERKNNVTLALERQRLKITKEDDAPGKMLVAKLAERGDDLLGLFAAYLSQKGLIANAPPGAVAVGVKLVDAAHAVATAVSPGATPTG